ncbi:MAG: hypothetical protein JNM84_14280 [Planctomycetes bacterium]|nr:hypothetical protein [Planctomycetota bacterium]
MSTTRPRYLALATLVAAALAALWIYFDLGRGTAPSLAPASELAPAREQEGAHANAAANDPAPRTPIQRAPAEIAPGSQDATGSIDRALDLHGIVQDREAQPIANALVSAVVFPWRSMGGLHPEASDEERSLTETRSAGDGSFRLRLERGRSVTLRVGAKGFALQELADFQAGERVVVTLQPAAALEVIARDEAGQPVPEVRVRFWRLSWNGAYDARRGTTDAEGRCVLDALPPGAGRLRCEHAVLGKPAWMRVVVGEAPRTTVEVVMPTGRIVRGRILDAETKEPIANARVGENWVLDRYVTSRADGSYELPGYTGNGSDDLHVIADGYGRMGKRVPEEGPLDFELVRGDRARGRVLSATKVPLGGALVSAVASGWGDGQQEIDQRSTTSGPDGVFELSSLRRDLPHTLIVRAEGHARLLLDFDPAPERKLLELGDLVLPPARRIAGRALDPEGTPLARARVALSGHNADRGRLRPTATAFAQDGYGVEEQRLSDDLGRFAFGELAPGSYRLTLHVDGAPEISQQVELTPAQDLEDLELRLSAGVSLRVLVVDDLEVPIARARVTASATIAEKAHRASAFTDAAGSCTLRSLPEGKVTLEVMSGPDEYLPVRLSEVQPTGQELRAVLRRLARIEGSVVDAAGAKIPDLLIEALPASGETQNAYADANGDFSIQAARGETYTLRLAGWRGVPIGSGRLRGMQKENSPWRGELAGIVAPAAQLLLRAESQPADGSLEVRVEDPAGRPVAGAVVTLGVRGKPTMKNTDAQGIARFEELVDEKMLVIASPPPELAGTLTLSTRIEARPGKDRITLKLRETEQITGLVLHPDGRPAAKVRLRLLVDEERFGIAVSDAEGRYVFQAPRGTTYRVVAQQRGADGAMKETSSDPFACGASPAPLRLQP